jgi:hypothetical protein
MVVLERSSAMKKTASFVDFLLGRKTIIAGVSVLLSATTAHASTEEGAGNFKSLPTYNLVCESMAFRNNNVNERSHVWFQIVPSEDVVKMINEKDETFIFPIVHKHTTLSNTTNQFGNAVVASFPVWIWFKDNGGKWRQIKDSSRSGYGFSYIYAPGGPENKGPSDHWAPYSCVLTS